MIKYMPWIKASWHGEHPKPPMLLRNETLAYIQLSILIGFCNTHQKSHFSVLQRHERIFSSVLLITSDWTLVCSLSPFSLFPLKLSLSPPLVPIHPTPTPEVKPYSWINLAAVWPNVHWHTSPHLSLSHAVYLFQPISPRRPVVQTDGGL